MTLNHLEIDDLAYRPASDVVVDNDGPLRGNTIFCDVSYTFQRKPHEDPNANTWGTWFDLAPVNTNQGLPMRAIGQFRGTTAVHWTSFGSPTLTNGPNIREQYIGFLERLVNETATLALWDVYNVAHYADECLERVRIECVRLLYDRDRLSHLSTDERAKLSSLITRLRE